MNYLVPFWKFHVLNVEHHLANDHTGVMNAAMEHQHRRSSSLPLITPFHDFSLRVNALRTSDLAVNLRRWNDGQDIERALLQLHDAVRRTEMANGTNGPLMSWNAPSRPSSAYTSSTTYRQDTFTPPRTPASSHTNEGLSHSTLRARMDDLRYRLERANADIDSLTERLTSARASLTAAQALEQALRSEVAARNDTIADLRETIAKQHQKLSRQRDTLNSSRSATPSSEQRQSSTSNRYDRHSASRSPPRPTNPRRHSLQTPVELDLEIATLNALLKRSKNDEAETLARSLLARGDITLNTAAKRTLCWTIALLCERQHKYAEAQRFLMSIPERTINDQSPKDETVLALLAHVELKLRDLSAAETHSRTLWKRYGLGYDEKWHGFHPANTLIQALALQKGGEDLTRRYWDAEAVWSDVHKHVVRSTLAERREAGWKEKVRKHAEAGLLLAREWKESCEQRGRVPRTADLVKLQAEEIKRLAS